MRPGAELVGEGLAFGYGATPVVDGVDLCIRPGERLAIVGPNGAGKSTILRLLSGARQPQRGRVRLGDRDLSSLPRIELARRLAVVPQETFIEFPFTALELVLMGRYPHLGGLGLESERDVAIALAAMGETDVAGLAHRRFHELSGGERQRVVIARALAQEPELLLLDEPATHLDLRHLVELFDCLSELAARGLGVAFVAHDLNVAALYADRVALVAGGRVLADGSADEVLTYANIREAFGIEVYVARNDLTGRLNVLPLPRKLRDELAARFGAGDG